ncbi:unnamed protein product [Clonostachys rosea f. rosea IK726]|uniref:Uncharacterized protein n=1 Tax=Clonostachys rosea f. rosea IK726 TaxID=1349383 RepID=A0ACA9UAN7_BIOOC|nr:unnamed protein product [Clonostachys rosea f. rosea IK726]
MVINHPIPEELVQTDKTQQMDAAIVLDQLPVLPTGSSGAMSAAPLPTAEVSEHLADEGIKEQQAPSGQNVKGDKGAKPKRKRVITEARKEQNRIAQRAFQGAGQRAKAEAKNQPGVKPGSSYRAELTPAIHHNHDRVSKRLTPQMGCPTSF